MMEEQAKKIHRWQDAGLGTAPYSFKGVWSMPSRSLQEQNPDAYNNAMREMPRGWGMGTCGYCGRGLQNNYMIQGADGTRFVVGCECVEKIGDAGLIKAVGAAEKARRREANARRAEKKREARQQALAVKQRIQERAERLRNGGLLTSEINERDRLRRAAVLRIYAAHLHDGMGGFRDSVASDMERGLLPSGRGFDIAVDILAKIDTCGSRSGSKKHQEAYTRISARLEALQDIPDWIMDHNEKMVDVKESCPDCGEIRDCLLEWSDDHMLMYCRTCGTSYGLWTMGRLF